MAFILTKKYVIALGAVGCLAIAGLGFNYSVMPTLDRVNTSQEAIDSAKTEVETMESRISSLKTAQTQFPQVQQIDAELSEQFPSEGGVQNLLSLIVQGASSQGIPANQVTSINFSPPELIVGDPAAGAATQAPAEEAPVESADGGAESTPATPEAQTSFGEGFAQVSISLSLSGTPEQIQGFLNYINEMPRVVVISQASMTDDNGNVVLSMSAKGYLFRPITTPADNQAEQAEQPVTEEETTEG